MVCGGKPGRQSIPWRNAPPGMSESVMPSRVNVPRLVCLSGALLSAVAAFFVLRSMTPGNDGPKIRRPQPNDRIRAEFVFAPKWTAGKLNDTLFRYRFA